MEVGLVSLPRRDHYLLTLRKVLDLLHLWDLLHLDLLDLLTLLRLIGGVSCENLPVCTLRSAVVIALVDGNLLLSINFLRSAIINQRLRLNPASYFIGLSRNVNNLLVNRSY